MVVLLIVLAVIGGAAEHGASATQLRRGPASVVLSVLITLAGLAGVASLIMLIWGLVTKNRRSLDSDSPRRHSPILVSGVMLAILACMAGLLALAARKGLFHPLARLGSGPAAHAPATGKPLPFSAAASISTSSIVIGIVALFVVAHIVRSLGWRRVLRRLRLAPREDLEADVVGGAAALEALSSALGALNVADAAAEPDPRRAVVKCYLEMLAIAGMHGPERRSTETPTEYLRRIFEMIGAAAGPAGALTELFEHARYNLRRPVDETMRAAAIDALAEIHEDLLAGAVA